MEDDYEANLFNMESERLTLEYHKAMSDLVLFKEQLMRQRELGVRASISDPPTFNINTRHSDFGTGNVLYINRTRIFFRESLSVMPRGGDGDPHIDPGFTLGEYDLEGNLIKRSWVRGNQSVFEGKIVSMGDEYHEDDNSITLHVPPRERFAHPYGVQNLYRGADGRVVIAKPYNWNERYDNLIGEMRDEEDLGEEENQTPNTLFFYHNGKCIPYVYDYESVDGHVILSFTIDGEDHKYRVSPGYDMICKIFMFGNECYYVASKTYHFDDVYGFKKYNPYGEEISNHHTYIIHARTMKECPFFNDIYEEYNNHTLIFQTEDFICFCNYGRQTFISLRE